MEGAGIGPVKLAVVLRVALGDVHHQHAFRARRLHQLDRAVEHSRFVVDRLEAVVPGAFRVGEVRLEVDQDDRGLLGPERFGRLRLLGECGARGHGGDGGKKSCQHSHGVSPR